METIVGRVQRSLFFCAVVNLGSFTAAARQLGCSKAHLSRQVAELERELGVQLLQRSTRRLVLTELGRRYWQQARGLSDALESAEQEVSLARSVVAGRLRITAATSFGEAFLVELVHAFRSQHPTVQVHLDLSIQRRDLVGEQFDFGFRSTRTLEERHVARALGVVRDWPVASPSLLAQHPRLRRPADLARLPCIANSHFRDDPEWVFVRGARSETVSVQGWLSINHFGAIRHAALQGAGVARLPQYLIADALGDGRLQRVLPEWDITPTPVYLVHPERRQSTRLQQAFRDHVIAWFAQPEREHLLR